jgi:pimeloyl-ACP methyl ester carboxylesterase
MLENTVNRSRQLKYGALAAGLIGIAAGSYYLLNSDLADHKHEKSTIKKPHYNDPNFTDYFRNKKGLYIFTRSNIPENPTAVIFLIHGMSEHSGREGYQWLQSHFLNLNFAVFALDHQGHGRSNGTRVHVETYHDFLDDIEQFINLSLGKKRKFERSSSIYIWS